MILLMPEATPRRPSMRQMRPHQCLLSANNGHRSMLLGLIEQIEEGVGPFETSKVI